jgi:WD40 repeat protein
VQVIIHHREPTARLFAAKHEISNPKSEAAVESSRGAKLPSVVRAHANGEGFRKFLQALLDPFFAVFGPFREQDRESDTTSDAVIPASYGDVDEMRARHCHGWSSSSDRPSLAKSDGCINSALRVLALCPCPPVDGVLSIEFSPDGKLLATAGSHDGEIKIWDSATRRVLHTLEPKTDCIWSVASGPDQKTLASDGGDGKIRLWDVAIGNEMRKFRGSTKEVMSIAFRNDGKVLASAGGNGIVKLWDFAIANELRGFQAHDGIVSRAVIHPNGKRFATAGADQTVKLWQVYVERSTTKSRYP